MNLEEVKIELLTQKTQLEARIEKTHRHTYQRTEPVSANFSEQIKQTENDELILNLEEEARQELQLISQALERIKSGTYLQCKHCGEDIGEARLHSVPFTAQCIDCANANE